MRTLPILLLVGSIAVILGRPSQTDENNESDLEEADYGGEDKATGDDSDSPDEESRLNEEPVERDIEQSGRIPDVSKNTYSYEQRSLAESRADRPHSDISDNKPYVNRDVRHDKAEETNNNYDDINNYAARRSSKYIENKDAADQQEATQHLTNRNVNYYKNNRIHNNMLIEDPLNKKESGLKTNLIGQGGMLFESQDRSSQADRNDFSNEPLELSKHYSKYYTQTHPENKEMIQCKNREGLYFNRDRRETKDSNVNSVSEIGTDKEIDKNLNEDEEMAIKRHIKKLSSDELEELLSSLSEEKRHLLKTIIDDTKLTVNIKDSVNKREITKKAGAVEENTYVESAAADSSSIHDSAVDLSTERSAQSSDTTVASKQTNTDSENTDLFKSTETNNKARSNDATQNEDAAQQKSVVEASDVGAAEKSRAELERSSNELVTTKNENKRETNLDDLADTVSFEEPNMIDNDWPTADSKDQQEYFCSQDEDLSQFLDDEQAAASDGSQIYKRDVGKQADDDAKIKSLEDSFSKSTNYDESAGPLIRVKRKNEPEMKKRSAAVLPDSKVAFFPYRAETDDEDNEEGNEFDDSGFYDRTPNFSSNVANKPTIRDAASCKLNDLERHASLSDISKGTRALGSDTGSVLSGVEGVDETLMFSSGARNRRTTEDISDVVDETNSIHNSKSLSDETKAVSDMNALTFQESDSFGPLPRNNEGESGRYKRIRRVKQSHPDSASSDT